MGCYRSHCGGSGGMDLRAQKRKSDAITREMKEHAERYHAIDKFLLLGTKGSDSTILTHIGEIYPEGVDFQIIKSIKYVISQSIMITTETMSTLRPPVSLEKAENHARLDYINKFNETYVKNYKGEQFSDIVFPNEFYDHTEELWKDHGVRVAFKCIEEHVLPRYAKYFLDKVHLIKQPDYKPTVGDCLRLKGRFACAGTIERHYATAYNGTLCIIEATGQSMERRKWLRLFMDVTAIIFVTDCSSYDVVLGENPTQNRLQESLELFESIRNNTWLHTKSVLLFLDKQDLLAEKILAGKSRLEDYFEDYSCYSTPHDVCPDPQEHPEVTRAKYFIRDKFLVS